MARRIAEWGCPGPCRLVRLTPQPLVLAYDGTPQDVEIVLSRSDCTWSVDPCESISPCPFSCEVVSQSTLQCSGSNVCVLAPSVPAKLWVCEPGTICWPQHPDFSPSSWSSVVMSVSSAPCDPGFSGLSGEILPAFGGGVWADFWWNGSAEECEVITSSSQWWFAVGGGGPGHWVSNSLCTFKGKFNSMALPNVTGSERTAILTFSGDFAAQFTLIQPSIPCPADFNNDGMVDGADLGVLLLHWGEEFDQWSWDWPAPLFDYNADGIIDGGDLGILLLQWGPCP